MGFLQLFSYSDFLLYKVFVVFFCHGLYFPFIKLHSNHSEVISDQFNKVPRGRVINLGSVNSFGELIILSLEDSLKVIESPG